MSEYRINLEIYNGPLDLLLYLIRRNEVEIEDIPIASITEQFLQYVALIKELNLEQAGDFLVMAATLMEIKSAMLLPREQQDMDEEDNSADPRLELVRQLLEYKKYKDLAGALAESAEQQADRTTRPLVDLARLKEQLKSEQELEMESLQIWDLFDAFNTLMKSTLANKRSHEVIHDETPIDIYETEILYRAQQEKPLTFQSVFENCKHRIEMVGMFLAMLELIRMKLIQIEQEQTFSPIYIFPLTDEEAELAVAHAVSGEIEKLPSHLNRDRKHLGDRQDTPDDQPEPPQNEQETS